MKNPFHDPLFYRRHVENQRFEPSKGILGNRNASGKVIVSRQFIANNPAQPAHQTLSPACDYYLNQIEARLQAVMRMQNDVESCNRANLHIKYADEVLKRNLTSCLVVKEKAKELKQLAENRLEKFKMIETMLEHELKRIKTKHERVKDITKDVKGWARCKRVQKHLQYADKLLERIPELRSLYASVDRHSAVINSMAEIANNLKQDAENWLTCGVCLNMNMCGNQAILHYTNNDTQAHLVCNDCMSQLKKMYRSAKFNSMFQTYINVSCPFCREDCPVPLSNRAASTATQPPRASTATQPRASTATQRRASATQPPRASAATQPRRASNANRLVVLPRASTQGASASRPQVRRQAWR
jgi:hypothetical protein